MSNCSVSDCSRPLVYKAKALCKFHYNRLLTTGTLELERLTPRQRFWTKVRKSPGCWQWTDKPGDHGYGTLSIDNRTHLAHRLAYEWLVGEIPAGSQLDHLCRNRSCVNPTHLEVVAQRENILRGTSPSALNAVKTHCDHGHEFDAANTYIRPDNGARMCRECKRIRDRARAAVTRGAR